MKRWKNLIQIYLSWFSALLSLIRSNRNHVLLVVLSVEFQVIVDSRLQGSSILYPLYPHFSDFSMKLLSVTGGMMYMMKGEKRRRKSNWTAIRTFFKWPTDIPSTFFYLFIYFFTYFFRKRAVVLYRVISCMTWQLNWLWAPNPPYYNPYLYKLGNKVAILLQKVLSLDFGWAENISQLYFIFRQYFTKALILP